jgi:hypothetical protein
MTGGPADGVKLTPADEKKPMQAYRRRRTKGTNKIPAGPTKPSSARSRSTIDFGCACG